ncbi:hypothetical protein L596_007324 [Steinernema carpocapsae]|uniref:Uncharacterized protein n=1 Tax=Steinernema carpocapsae TaxID=34508 RepID=A0A4U5P8W7_STECR|nr:hypothetical protein L596_007324 [Steinernema carpocapsae]
MGAAWIIFFATTVGSAAAMSEGLRGDHVCTYEDSLVVDSDSSNDTLAESYEPLLIKQCCPGYETSDRITCHPTSVYVNPLTESRFTAALGLLFFALVGVGLFSMLIAYMYHYRYVNRSHQVIQLRNHNFEELIQGVPNLGFTYAEKPTSASLIDEKFVPDLQLR